MHHKNNNNGAQHYEDRSADGLRSQDPLLATKGTEQSAPANRRYSEATRAVMDEMSGTADSRRATVYNDLKH